MLTTTFGATVDSADTLDEALSQVKTNSYDLVLVNRVLDLDGSPGLNLLVMLREEPTVQAPPVMLVSNYPDAQAAAIAAGAEPGFGKSSLHSPATVELLRSYLG